MFGRNLGGEGRDGGKRKDNGRKSGDEKWGPIGENDAKKGDAFTRTDI